MCSGTESFRYALNFLNISDKTVMISVELQRRDYDERSIIVNPGITDRAG